MKHIIALKMDKASTGPDGKHVPFMYVCLCLCKMPFGSKSTTGYRLVYDRAEATSFPTAAKATDCMQSFFRFGEPVEVQS